MVDSLIDVTCRKGFEHVKPDDHQRRYAAQSVEYVVVGFRICKCRRRDFCFRHGWLFLLLFGVNWLFTGCKYTKSAVQIGHEPHFSSLLPYFAGFAARFRRPLCCPLPSSVSARPLAPLPFASAAPAPVSRPPASRPCSASLLCVPALRPCPAFRPGPFPRRLLRTLPCPSPLSLPGFGSPPPRPAGPAAPVPSSHGPSGPPSSARRCSRIIPRPCTRRETPSPAVWRSAVSGR